MKSNFLFRIAGLFFFINFYFSSCTPHFYKPKPLEPVLLTKKNQLKINTITDFSIGTVSAAYSPKQNLGIQLGVGSNHYKSSGTDNTGRDTIYLNEYYFNPYLSVGYYKNISQDILFEAYGGIGMYNYKNTAISYLKSMKNINIYIQPTIVYIQKNFDASFTLRIDYFNRNKTRITDSVLSADDVKKYQFLNYKNYFFVQPGFTIKGGLKNVKAQFQISESIPFSKNYRSIYGYGYQFLVFDTFRNKNKLLYSFGLTIELNDLFNKKK